MKILCPSKSYSKMYGKEPRHNDLRYNNNLDITINLVDRAYIIIIISKLSPKSAELLNRSHRMISNFSLIQRLSTMTHNVIAFLASQSTLSLELLLVKKHMLNLPRYNDIFGIFTARSLYREFRYKDTPIYNDSNFTVP